MITDPNAELDLRWHIGPWTDIWRIGRFTSQAAASDVDYYIYLPPGYDSGTKRYPVLYWLHGSFSRPYDATPIVSRLDKAIRAGKTTEMIVVSCLEPAGLSMWTDSKDGRLPVETVIIEELIPHIDASYRTIPDRQDRAIEGFSMGGYGAAYLGLKYDDLFSAVSIIAGALHTPETLRERRKAIFQNVFSSDIDYASERSPWQLAKARADAVRNGTSIRVSVGELDDLRDWNEQYHRLLDELSIDHDWTIVPDGPHDLEALMKNWPGDYFAWYSRNFGRVGA